MKTINIDEECEPIQVIVGGKEYTIIDISNETAQKMRNAGDLDETSDAADKATVGILADILSAQPEEIAKLGFRKRMLLVTRIATMLSEDIEGKNAPKAVAAK